MTKIDLPYVKAYQDRKGVWRFYFRRKKRNYGALPGVPGSTRARWQSAGDVWARDHQLLFVSELHQSQAVIETKLSLRPGAAH